MLINHFKVAWRNLIQNRTFCIINIGGLAIGMAVALLIGLWIHEEMSFNTCHKNYDHIARVMQHQQYSDGIHTDKAVPMVLGEALHGEYSSQFKYVVLSSWTNPHVLSYGEKTVSCTGNFMEQSAPDMLTLNMTNGSADGLKDPSSVLLSHSAAGSLFGSGDAIGKTIKLDAMTLKVTGVYEDLPESSSFHEVRFIAPWSDYAGMPENESAKGDWNHNSFQLFAQVADGRKMDGVSAAIKDVKLRALGKGAAQLNPRIFLHPMSRWHLYADFKDGINTGGAIQYVRMFIIIGVFVLLLACINFMNLSTARSERRAKEVGIRKAVGSLRRQLIGQFYTESFLTTMIGFMLSLLVTQLTLPLFNEVTGKRMIIPWDSTLFWLMVAGGILVTSLIAGSYPALYLSSFKPIKVLKGTFRAGPGTAVPRRFLVVVQFTASVIMIVGTVVVYRQVQFARNRPVGYSKQGLIIIRPYSSDYHNHFNSMLNDLQATGAVTSMAESGNSITRGSGSSGGLFWKGKDPNMRDEFTAVGVSADYGRTVGWQFIEGRDFVHQSPADSNALIINEAAVKYMGLRHPLGEQVVWDRTYTIVGVVRDVVMTSPYEPVKQAVYHISPWGGYLNIRVNPRVSVAEAIGKIEAVCKKYSPSAPFEYKFADEEYAGKFSDEQRIGDLASVLAVLAILISCIGLFGLASYIAEQRTREIGIRKVLGASVYSLWQLQSKEFLILVMISLMIALPAAWYFMHSWLENYYYRVELTWWVFASTGIAAIGIALLTVSFQSIKAALLNPATSLRTEG